MKLFIQDIQVRRLVISDHSLLCVNFKWDTKLQIKRTLVWRPNADLKKMINLINWLTIYGRSRISSGTGGAIKYGKGKSFSALNTNHLYRVTIQIKND